MIQWGALTLLHRGNLNLRRVASVCFPPPPPVASALSFTFVFIHPVFFPWGSSKRHSFSQEESFLRADSAEDFEIFKDWPLPRLTSVAQRLKNSVFVQQTLYFQLPVTNRFSCVFFWLQLCVIGYFPKSVALISITMLAYIWQRKSVTHLKRDEYLSFPAWKKGALQPSPVLKPNEKAPPAGESLPLSFPCVLCVGTVTRFSCGSHRPAYSWLTTAKKRHGGLAAGCPGPTNAKRESSQVLAQKKK